MIEKVGKEGNFFESQAFKSKKSFFPRVNLCIILQSLVYFLHSTEILLKLIRKMVRQNYKEANNRIKIFATKL